MTDLTEQWDKGKLPEGDYYIKRRNGLLLYDNIDSRGVWRNSIDEDIIEVLAPVPSYEEWQEKLQALDAAHKAIKMEDETINRLVCSGKQCNYEKGQLKELLKECREPLEVLAEKRDACDWCPEDLLTKINQALGEEK